MVREALPAATRYAAPGSTGRRSSPSERDGQRESAARRSIVGAGPSPLAVASAAQAKTLDQETLAMPSSFDQIVEERAAR